MEELLLFAQVSEKKRNTDVQNFDFIFSAQSWMVGEANEFFKPYIVSSTEKTNHSQKSVVPYNLRPVNKKLTLSKSSTASNFQVMKSYDGPSCWAEPYGSILLWISSVNVISKRSAFHALIKQLAGLRATWYKSQTVVINLNRPIWPVRQKLLTKLASSDVNTSFRGKHFSQIKYFSF